jgi:hypothetical protein
MLESNLKKICMEMKAAERAAQPFNRTMMNYTLIILLALGLISPVFRQDTEAIFVSAVCAAILLLVATRVIWKRR